MFFKTIFISERNTKLEVLKEKFYSPEFLAGGSQGHQFDAADLINKL